MSTSNRGNDAPNPVKLRTVLVVLLLAIMVTVVPTNTSHAQTQSVFSEQSLEDPAQRALFKELAAELRCLVCQNQNIADSNATLAQDLRREIHTMISRGDSKSQIIDFMVARYGEFVLYRPRFSTKTLVLWIGPFLLFAAGLIALWMQARKPRAAVSADTESLEAARKLLQDDTSDDNKRA